jgi:acetylglutamate kinase
VTRLVVKIGGSVAAGSASHVLDLVASGNEVCVVHGAGPQISREMELAGIPVEFVGGRRVTTVEGIGIVRASLAAVNETLCAAIGERAEPFFGDEIGLEADAVPELGLVGEARPSALPAIIGALEAGKIPVVAPIARGPLNVNADSASAAIAAGIHADRLLFLTDVDGLILDGEVVDAIDVAAAEELLASGTLEGGIIPKLGAAVAAARGGVPASIGRTLVSSAAKVPAA